MRFQNCQNIKKNNFGNIFKIFFENQQISPSRLFISSLQKIWRKKPMVMEISPHIQNSGASRKMPKDSKNNLGNIFKIFFENRRIVLIFKKYFFLKMFPKLEVFCAFQRLFSKKKLITWSADGAQCQGMELTGGCCSLSQLMELSVRWWS